MKIITNFEFPHWLITPVALAVNEPRPQNIKGQKWLIVLSGVGITDVKGEGSNWFRLTLDMQPDILPPLDHAINKHQIQKPSNAAVAFQVEQWAPFAAVSSMFNQNVSVNSGFAVDRWRAIFDNNKVDAVTNQTLTNIFRSIEVDVAVRDIDAILHRVSYNITLLGKIVFNKADILL